MKNKATAIIQARMSSSRLPGKVLMEMGGKTVLHHIFTRLRKCENIDKIILATSTDKSDDPVFNEAAKHDIPCFRGSLTNVLSRYYGCAKLYGAKHILRVCADSPLLDYKIYDEIIDFHFKEQRHTTCTTNLPNGMNPELFSFYALELAYKNATEEYQREHVSPYIHENFVRAFFPYPTDYTHYRITLDTPEDLQVISAIFKNFESNVDDFLFADVAKFLTENPHIAEINKEIVQIKPPFKVNDKLID